jgi:hypothetical protein
MKARLSLCLLLVAGYAAQAQVEVDDMYFNSKDRAKERANRKEERVYREEKSNDEEIPSINPTDSYSSRKVNPEYASQQNSNNQSEDPEYFLSGYQATGVNKKLNNSNSYYGPNGYGNSSYWGNSYAMSPYMMSPYMGMGMNYGYGSPFGSYYSPYDPFMRFGYGYPYNSWSMSFGNSWGSYYPYSSWNSWGSPYSYGYGNSFYNSWAWSGGYYNSWGNPYCYYSRYPAQVIIINNDGGNRAKVVYGKRQDRSSSLDNPIDHSRATTGNGFTRNGRQVSSGRGRTEANEQSFYDRNWKTNNAITKSANTSRSYWGTTSNTSRQNGNNSSFNNNSNTTRTQRSSNWGNDFFNNNNSNSNSNSRSWSNSNSTSSFSSGSRSAAPSHSTGGGGGATRSRGRD